MPRAQKERPGSTTPRENGRPKSPAPGETIATPKKGKAPRKRKSSLTFMQDSIVWLQKVPIFSNIPINSLAVVADMFELLKFKEGDTVVKQGGVGDSFYVVEDGEVGIWVTGPDGDDIHICNKQEGFFFGEVSLVGDVQRTATVVSNQNAQINRLSRPAFLELIERIPDLRQPLMDAVQSRMKANITSIPFFNSIDTTKMGKDYRVLGAFDLLGSLFEVESIEKKDYIFSEGDEADKFYIIISGVVKISATNETGDTVFLDMLMKDGYFGELSLVQDVKRVFTARAFEPTLLLSLEKESFQRFLKIVPGAIDKLHDNISYRTAKTLKNVAFFNDLSWDKRELLGALLDYVEFEAGKTLYKQGSLSDGIYVLVKGEVQSVMRCSKDDRPAGIAEERPSMLLDDQDQAAAVLDDEEDPMKGFVSEAKEGGDGDTKEERQSLGALGDDEEEVVVETIHPMEVIGEMSFFTHAPRESTLKVTKDSLLLRLRGDKYQQFILIAPDLRKKFRQVAEVRRRSSENLLRTLSLSTNSVSTPLKDDEDQN